MAKKWIRIDDILTLTEGVETEFTIPFEELDEKLAPMGKLPEHFFDNLLTCAKVVNLNVDIFKDPVEEEYVIGTRIRPKTPTWVRIPWYQAALLALTGAVAAVGTVGFIYGLY